MWQWANASSYYAGATSSKELLGYDDLERLGTRLGYTFHTAEERYAKVCKTLGLEVQDTEVSVDRDEFVAALRGDSGAVEKWFDTLQLRMGKPRTCCG